MLLLTIAGIVGCEDILGVDDIPKRWEAKLTFRNNSDSLICFATGGSVDRQASDPCDEVGPRKKTVWRPTCGYGDEAEYGHLTVVLNVRSDGREIYKRRETCRFWEDAGAVITIEGRGEELRVEDNLPDPTRVP